MSAGIGFCTAHVRDGLKQTLDLWASPAGSRVRHAQRAGASRESGSPIWQTTQTGTRRLNAHSLKAEQPLSYRFYYHILDRFIAGSSLESYFWGTKRGPERSRDPAARSSLWPSREKQVCLWTSLPTSAI